MLNRYEQMEQDIQNKILKVIKDRKTFETITDGKSAIFHNLETSMDYFAWPGMYPLYYITKDCAALCPKCVNENITLLSDKDDPQWYLIGVEVNYENTSLYCDHCNEQIESAYGDDE
jgi:hypothetical protein